MFALSHQKPIPCKMPWPKNAPAQMAAGMERPGDGVSAFRRGRRLCRRTCNAFVSSRIILVLICCDKFGAAFVCANIAWFMLLCDRSAIIHHDGTVPTRNRTQFFCFVCFFFFILFSLFWSAVRIHGPERPKIGPRALTNFRWLDSL